MVAWFAGFAPLARELRNAYGGDLGVNRCQSLQGLGQPPMEPCKPHAKILKAAEPGGEEPADGMGTVLMLLTEKRKGGQTMRFDFD